MSTLRKAMATLLATHGEPVHVCLPLGLHNYMPYNMQPKGAKCQQKKEMWPSSVIGEVTQ